MSDTPKTDAVTIPPHHSVTSDYSQLEIHARALERENAKLREALTGLAESWLHRHAQTDDNRNLLYCRDELLRLLK